METFKSRVGERIWHSRQKHNRMYRGTEAGKYFIMLVEVKEA